MVRTRSGSRRKEKSPLQTIQVFYASDLDYPYSPPVHVQSSASPSMRMCPLGNIKKSFPSLNSTLKAARRVIPTNENIKPLRLSSPDVKPTGSPNLVIQSHVGQDDSKVATLLDQDIHVNPPSRRESCVISGLEDTMPEKSTTSYAGKSSQCLSTSLKSTGSPNLVVQSHVGQDASKVATLIVSDQDIHVNPPFRRENCVISHLKDTMPEKSTTSYAGKSSQCLSTSLNLTEFVRRQLDDEDDDDEVESALDPAFNCVNGHKVKRENAPLLRAIFDKYGDITKETEGQPPTIVSFFLERVCAIYERLKGTKFSNVTLKDLTEMLDEVWFSEREKFNLGWLHQKLEHIYNTKVSSQNYLTAKEGGEKCDNIIRSLEEKLEAHKREVSLILEKLVEEKYMADRYKKMACDIKTRVNDLRARPLVHDLL